VPYSLLIALCAVPFLGPIRAVWRWALDPKGLRPDPPYVTWCHKIAPRLPH
jgi:hypothetical protein